MRRRESLVTPSGQINGYQPDDMQINNSSTTLQTTRMDGPLPPEDDDGNVEYKCLVRGDSAHIEHLTTQMEGRLRAGRGRAVYWVGVMDDGCKVGLAEPHFSNSIEHLRTVASKVGATVGRVDVQRITTPPPTMHRRLQPIAPAGVERRVARVAIQSNYVPTEFAMPTTPPRRSNIVDLCVL